MKKLLFLTLALIGLGLSSCDKDPPLLEVSCTNCIEIYNISVHDYQEFYNYGWYSPIWDHWDKDKDSPIEKRPDLFVQIQQYYPVDKFIYEGNILAENAPLDSTILLSSESVFIPADSFPYAYLELLDQDSENGVNSIQRIGGYRINPREIMDNQDTYVFLGAAYETQLSFNVKFH